MSSFFSFPAVICGLFITGFAFVVPLLGKFVIQVVLYFINTHSATSVPKNWCCGNANELREKCYRKYWCIFNEARKRSFKKVLRIFQKSFLKVITMAYSEPCKKFKMGAFWETSQKNSILDIWQGSEYAFELLKRWSNLDTFLVDTYQ